MATRHNCILQATGSTVTVACSVARSSVMLVLAIAALLRLCTCQWTKMADVEGVVR